MRVRTYEDRRLWSDGLITSRYPGRRPLGQIPPWAAWLAIRLRAPRWLLTWATR